VHCPDGCGNYKEGWFGYRRGWGHWIKAENPLPDEYNIIAGEWNADGIRWYFNGELVAVAQQKMPLPMALIVGTGAARENGPFAPGPDKDTPFPNIFEVDYVRVYEATGKPAEKKETKAEVVTPINFANEISKTKRVGRSDVKALVTVSLIKNGEQASLRCLGLQKGQTVRLVFVQNGYAIHEEVIATNSEFPVSLTRLKNVTLKIEALGRTTSYNLN
jgi:hypothetical protein